MHTHRTACRRLLVAAMLAIAAAVAPAQSAAQYASPGWDAQYNLFKMSLNISINPTTRAVVINQGFMEINHSGSGYRVLQAQGARVPRLGPNQMAGDVFFSQAGGSVTATLFGGQLNGAFNAAGSTLQANNVRFQYMGRTFQVNFTMLPQRPTPGPAPNPGPGPSPAPGPSPGPGPVNVLFDCSNVGGVLNGPPRAATVFNLGRSTKVTSIWTYHWNGGRGQVPGTISLRDAAGRNWGTWQARGSAGQGNMQNVNWTVGPNVTLPPGSYTILDSAPATWSQNPQSGGRGFAKVWGQ